MCVGATEVLPKKRAQKLHVSIVEYGGESVAHSHEPRSSVGFMQVVICQDMPSSRQVLPSRMWVKQVM